MYVKYISSLTDTVQVQQIKRFVLRTSDCEEEDGSITHGAAICDGGLEDTAFFLDLTVETLSGYLLDSAEEVLHRRYRKRDRITPISDVMADYGSLAWFNSWSAAESVLNEMCQALANGLQFFDLTEFGEDGRRVSRNA